MCPAECPPDAPSPTLRLPQCEWHEGVRCEDRERSAAEAKADAQFFKCADTRNSVKERRC